MNTQEYIHLRRTAEAALAMVQALAAQVDRVSERVLELEQQQRPKRIPMRLNDGERAME